jgi:hypothetical protein
LSYEGKEGGLFAKYETVVSSSKFKEFESSLELETTHCCSKFEPLDSTSLFEEVYSSAKFTVLSQ